MPNLNLSGHSKELGALANALSHAFASPPVPVTIPNDTSEEPETEPTTPNAQSETIALARADGRSPEASCWYTIALDRLPEGNLKAEIGFRQLGRDRASVTNLTAETLDELINALEAYDPHGDVPVPMAPDRGTSSLAHDMLTAVSWRRAAAEAAYQYKGLLGELLLAVEQRL